ncbi:hypothetical protein [Flavobacterium oreochromis]|nr:hypothetical protein [Flavobacterium oreochromis]
MYSKETIDVISKKIGWPITNQPITLSLDNRGTSVKRQACITL